MFIREGETKNKNKSTAEHLDYLKSIDHCIQDICPINKNLGYSQYLTNRKVGR